MTKRVATKLNPSRFEMNLPAADSVTKPPAPTKQSKLGKLSKLGQASERIKDVRDAKRAVTYMGRVEESANDMEAIDKLESVFLNIDASLQSDLRRDTLQVAQAMHEAGKKGDRVATLLMNGPEFVETFFGAARVGGVIVALNWRLVADELSFVLTDSGASTMVFGSAFTEVVAELHGRGSDGTQVNRWIHVGDADACPDFAEQYDEVVNRASSDAPESNASLSSPTAPNSRAAIAAPRTGSGHNARPSASNTTEISNPVPPNPPTLSLARAENSPNSASSDHLLGSWNGAS